mmetsp:Transcript_37055/g.71081  ORF Transcript_37055/g.71081 Transcript_37055/m.71081 type:complete len:267 (-) Transcript_37055:433-1233(-)
MHMGSSGLQLVRSKINLAVRVGQPRVIAPKPRLKHAVPAVSLDSMEARRCLFVCLPTSRERLQRRPQAQLHLRRVSYVNHGVCWDGVEDVHHVAHALRSLHSGVVPELEPPPLVFPLGPRRLVMRAQQPRGQLLHGHVERLVRHGHKHVRLGHARRRASPRVPVTSAPLPLLLLLVVGVGEVRVVVRGEQIVHLLQSEERPRARQVLIATHQRHRLLLVRMRGSCARRRRLALCASLRINSGPVRLFALGRLRGPGYGVVAASPAH